MPCVVRAWCVGSTQTSSSSGPVPARGWGRQLVGAASFGVPKAAGLGESEPVLLVPSKLPASAILLCKPSGGGRTPGPPH